ncbi:hypothetical protein HPB51_017162 [Rhipicephalus microplus]|uniref:Uncharacterized protein n=1 Tax=Rhipicephalus microplus TaxID=6941 RepID=A0A9J6DPF5_RHIMP|nr:hypothetical protein HPB51_017162 [Rhipicephalus microplus]
MTPEGTEDSDITSAGPVTVVGEPTGDGLTLGQARKPKRKRQRSPAIPHPVNPTPLQYSGHATPRSQAAPSPELSTSLGRLRDGCLEGSPAASKGAGDRSHSTDPAVAGTVLYRNSTPGGSFTGSLHLRLAAALAKKPGVTAVRVQHRRKIVGADAGTPACLSELLTIKELSGFPLTARESADRRSSVGFLHGVDGDLTDLELTTGRASTVLILAASNGGQTVRLRFASSQPPNQVTFCGLLLRV